MDGLVTNIIWRIGKMILVNKDEPKFTKEYRVVNTMKEGVDMGISPLEIIAEAYKIVEDTKDVKDYKERMDKIVYTLKLYYKLR